MIFDGRVLSAAELRKIRREIESLDTIEAVSEPMRALIEKQWPHLVAKLPPPKQS